MISEQNSIIVKVSVKDLTHKRHKLQPCKWKTTVNYYFTFKLAYLSFDYCVMLELYFETSPRRS